MRSSVSGFMRRSATTKVHGNGNGKQNGKDDGRRVPPCASPQRGDKIARKVVYGVQQHAQPQIGCPVQHHRAHGADRKRVSDLPDHGADPSPSQ